MTNRHWHLNMLQFPRSVHICVTKLQADDGNAERFLKDLRDSIAEVKYVEYIMIAIVHRDSVVLCLLFRRANPKAFKDGSAAIYGIGFVRRILSVASMLIAPTYETGMAESIPDRGMVESMAKQFIDALYTV